MGLLVCRFVVVTAWLYSNAGDIRPVDDREPSGTVAAVLSPLIWRSMSTFGVNLDVHEAIAVAMVTLQAPFSRR